MSWLAARAQPQLSLNISANFLLPDYPQSTPITSPYLVEGSDVSI